MSDLKDKLYVRVWTRLLHCFLGWDEAKVLRWAEKYRRELTDPNEYDFYRDDYLHYILDLVIPEDLKRTLSVEELRDLKVRVAVSTRTGAMQLPPRLLEVFEYPSGFGPAPSPEMREELSKFEANAVKVGTLLRGNPDDFDWNAARERVEAIFQCFRSREQVPSLAAKLQSTDEDVRCASAKQLSRMGKLAAPAINELVGVVRGYLDQPSAMYAVEALCNIAKNTPAVAEVLRYAAVFGKSRTRTKARYAHRVVTGDCAKWDNPI